MICSMASLTTARPSTRGLQVDLPAVPLPSWLSALGAVSFIGFAERERERVCRRTLSVTKEAFQVASKLRH